MFRFTVFYTFLGCSFKILAYFVIVKNVQEMNWGILQFFFNNKWKGNIINISYYFQYFMTPLKWSLFVEIIYLLMDITEQGIFDLEW